MKVCPFPRFILLPLPAWCKSGAEPTATSLPRFYLNVTMASTEDTAATGAAAAAASTTGGMHYMYAEAVEQYEANVAAASMGGTDEGGQASGKPSNSDATTGGASSDDKTKKSKPRGHLPWKLAKELPSPEGEANPWNRTGGGQPVSQLQNGRD